MPFVPSGRGRIKMSRQVQDKAGGQGDSWEDCGKAQGRGGLENIWAKGGMSGKPRAGMEGHFTALFLSD